MPKPGSKPIPRPIAAADGDSLAGSIQQAQSDHAASHGGKSLPTPNLAHGGHVPAPNAPVPRPQSDGWGAGGQKGGVQRANGAAAFGYGFGQGGVNATADAMGDLSVGQKGGGGANPSSFISLPGPAFAWWPSRIARYPQHLAAFRRVACANKVVTMAASSPTSPSRRPLR